MFHSHVVTRFDVFRQRYATCHLLVCRPKPNLSNQIMLGSAKQVLSFSECILHAQCTFKNLSDVGFHFLYRTTHLRLHDDNNTSMNQNVFSSKKNCNLISRVSKSTFQAYVGKVVQPTLSL